MNDARWVKRMITGVVLSIAGCAVVLFTGCSVGVLKGDQCDNGQERAFGVLTALLTTVMGLAVKLDALDEPKISPTPRTRSRSAERQ